MDDQDYEDEDTSFEPVGKCKICGDPVVSAAGGVFGADFDFCGEHAEPDVMRT